MKQVTIIRRWKSDFFVKEAFNTFRTNVLFCGKSIKTIVVTSCMDSEGKSTIAYELARGFADNGERVLFIDSDLRKSVFALNAKVDGTIVGLSQILSGQVSLEDATYATDTKNLDMIFAGPFPPNPAELLTSEDFRTLLSTLREQYDHVIIDTAPLGLVVDAAVIARICDGAILVVNRGQIKSRMAQSVKQQLERSGCQILGAVLNQTTRRGGHFGYGYYYDHYGHRRAYRSAYRYGGKALPEAKPAKDKK